MIVSADRRLYQICYQLADANLLDYYLLIGISDVDAYRREMPNVKVDKVEYKSEGGLDT